MSSASRQLGLSSCHDNNAGSACGVALNSFMQSLFGMSVTSAMFWWPYRHYLACLWPHPCSRSRRGDPYVHLDAEHHRTRWFTIKVALLGSITMGAAAALAACGMQISRHRSNEQLEPVSSVTMPGALGPYLRLRLPAFHCSPARAQALMQALRVAQQFP
jgi:hypothetical protein